MKVKVAIPCYYYAEVEMDLDPYDIELEQKLKNDVVEDLQYDDKYGQELYPKLSKMFKKIEQKGFDISEDHPILFWVD